MTSITARIATELGVRVQQELHATDYLLKPVGRDHLISVVSDYCDRTEQQW